MDIAQWWEQLSTRLRLDREVLDNPIAAWVAAAVILVGGTICLRLAKSVICRRARKRAERTGSDWSAGVRDVLNATRLWFMFVVAFYLATLTLELPRKAQAAASSLAAIALWVQAALWGTAVLRVLIDRWSRRRLESDPASVMMASFLGFTARLALWSIAALLILENLGIQVTALVAGLGIGGVAVALAAQNILGDLFASLSIVVDRPFVLGDFIIVGDMMGTVENIGLKTTRVRSLGGEQLVFPNNDLLQSRIRNYKRMAERRVLFSFGVTYSTSVEKLEAIPMMVREIVTAQQRTRFDRAHFQSFGDSALVFEVVYYVLTRDYNPYMDIQQAINLELVRRFQERGIEFAFPTRTLHVEMQDAPRKAEPVR